MGKERNFDNKFDFTLAVSSSDITSCYRPPCFVPALKTLYYASVCFDLRGQIFYSNDKYSNLLGGIN